MSLTEPAGTGGPEARDGSAPAIYGFGTAAVDFRIRTAELGPDYRDKLLARGVEVVGGGVAANFLVQVSRLGGRARWLGKLGRDWIGDEIVRQLEAEGVDCSNAIRDQGHCSPFNVAVYAGERRRRVGAFLLPNSLVHLGPAELERLAAPLRRRDWLMVEVGEIPIGPCARLAEEARRRGSRVAIDVDLDPVVQCGLSGDDLSGLFRGADLLMPNRVAMASLYPGLSAEALAARLVRETGTATVVSSGQEGAWYCEPGRTPAHQPALPTVVVDTVGAGDAFHGGLIFALACGQPLPEAVELGTRCAAAKCARSGTRAGMLTAADLGIRHSPRPKEKRR